MSSPVVAPVSEEDVKELESPGEAEEVESESEEVSEEEEKGKEETEEEEVEEEEEEEPSKIPFDRPTLKEIKTKYPDFFKDFPSLRDAIFREAAYTSMFPTVEDAKEAFEDNEAFSTLRESALKGDPEPLLESLEAADKESAETFATAFLPTLYRRNQALYQTVVTPLLENLARALFNTNDENLKNTALNLSKFLFNDEGVAKGEKTFSKNGKDPEARGREVDASLDKKFADAYRVVHGSIEKALAAQIRKGLDPNDVFTPFLRRQVITEVIGQIGNQLQKDEGHMKIMGARWAHARSLGYTEQETAKIVTAYLARASKVMPVIREKVRQQALHTTKKAAESRARQVSETVAKPEVRGGKSTSVTTTPSKTDYRKMTDIDILNAE